MPEDGAEMCDTATTKMGTPANLQHADQLHDGEEPTRASSNNRVGEVIDEAHRKHDSLVGVLNAGTARFEFGTKLHTEEDLVYDIDSRVAEPGACLLVPPETRPENENLVESNGSGPKSKQCGGVLASGGNFEVEFAGGLEPLSRENSSIESSADDWINDALENKPTVGVQGSALIHDKVESCSGALYSNDTISSSFMAAMENLSKDFNRRICETKMTFDSDGSKCSSGSLNCNADSHIQVRNGEPSDSFIISENTIFSQENSGSSGVWNNGGAGQIMDGETGNAEVDATGINIKSLSQHNKKLEVNISKKVALSKFPSNVTEFLGTGLLDGCPVRYINPGEQKILHGTIKEGGFLCNCSSCNGTKILTALDFECHAGFLTRHAYSYIFVPNGMRLYAAVRRLRDAPPSMLDELIRSITGLAPKNGHSGHHDKKVEELPRFRRKLKVSQHSQDKSYIHTCRKRTVPRRLQDTSYIQNNKVCSGSLRSSENSQNPKRRKVSKHSTSTNRASIRSPLMSKLSRNVSTLQSELTNAPQAAVEVEHKKIKLRISMKTDTPKVTVSIDEVREANNAEDVMKKRSPGLDIACELKESDPKDGGSIFTMQQENGHGFGKKKKKDTSLHKLVFMSDGLPDGTELAYFIRGQKLLEGYKHRNGIVCSCCSTVVSPSQFEAHAGWASRRQPYHYICTSSGLSLHEICVSLSKGRKHSARYNDDLCTMCGDGGDLLLCDGCPRAFHAGCLEEERLSNTSWYCRYCKEKAVHGSAAFSGDPPLNALPGCNLEERKVITIRCKRVIKAPTTVIGGCVVCRRHDFSKGRFGERTVILCDQCEKEFHVGCLRDAGLCNLEALPKGKWFCNGTCSNIHSQLNQFIVDGPAEFPDSASSIIARKSEGKCLSTIQTNVEWQLLNGRTASPRNRMLLSRAAAIFRDCFDPIVEISGRDLIPAMVYGRNVGGREFGGMCCAVLLVNSVVVSAGLLRIFGQEVAELPLVATSREYQGQGYFQSLFFCIQSLLTVLNVKNLVLPAAEDAESMWTKKFGFNKLTEEQLRKYTKDLPMMVFQGTAMLEKELLQLHGWCGGRCLQL